MEEVLIEYIENNHDKCVLLQNDAYDVYIYNGHDRDFLGDCVNVPIKYIDKLIDFLQKVKGGVK